MSELTDTVATSKSSDWSKRQDIAPRLAEFDAVEADQALAQLLDDEDLAVIDAAASALVRRADRDALRLIAEALDNEDLDTVDHVRAAIRRGSRSDPRIRAVLSELAEDPTESDQRRRLAELALKEVRPKPKRSWLRRR